MKSENGSLGLESARGLQFEFALVPVTESDAPGVELVDAALDQHVLGLEAPQDR